ncbi:hypothetical protein M2271_003519 [Streptomyces sp. LBL]|nr:hypothetical protein [Streptomyces sp. LBL]
MVTLLEMFTVSIFGCFVLKLKIPIRVLIYAPGWNTGRRGPCVVW